MAKPVNFLRNTEEIAGLAEQCGALLAMPHEYSLILWLRQHVTKPSEVCHWIVAANDRGSTRLRASSDVESGQRAPSDSQIHSPFLMLAEDGLRDAVRPQLQVQYPEEMTFVEQQPITIGGPGDLMQVALPEAEDRIPSEELTIVDPVCLCCRS